MPSTQTHTDPRDRFPPSLEPPALLLLLGFFFLLSNMKFVKMPRGSNLCLYEKFLNECDTEPAWLGGGEESQPEDLLVVVSVSLAQEDLLCKQTLRSTVEVFLIDRQMNPGFYTKYF